MSRVNLTISAKEKDKYLFNKGVNELD